MQARTSPRLPGIALELLTSTLHLQTTAAEREERGNTDHHLSREKEGSGLDVGS